eukprot:scaffold6740_cov126-Isochrysis_galbana.AAC.3
MYSFLFGSVTSDITSHITITTGHSVTSHGHSPSTIQAWDRAATARTGAARSEPLARAPLLGLFTFTSCTTFDSTAQGGGWLAYTRVE